MERNILILAVAAAVGAVVLSSLVLLNQPAGRQAAQDQFPKPVGYCGDGICAVDELASCSLDCEGIKLPGADADTSGTQAQGNSNNATSPAGSVQAALANATQTVNTTQAPANTTPSVNTTPNQVAAAGPAKCSAEWIKAKLKYYIETYDPVNLAYIKAYNKYETGESSICGKSDADLTNYLKSVAARNHYVLVDNSFYAISWPYHSLYYGGLSVIRQGPYPDTTTHSSVLNVQTNSEYALAVYRALLEGRIGSTRNLDGYKGMPPAEIESGFKTLMAHRVVYKNTTRNETSYYLKLGVPKDRTKLPPLYSSKVGALDRDEKTLYNLVKGLREATLGELANASSMSEEDVDDILKHLTGDDVGLVKRLTLGGVVTYEIIDYVEGVKSLWP